MKNNLKTRVVSPKSFPLDPGYEQTRTPIKSLRPGHRSTGHRSRDSSLLLNLPNEILWLIVELIAEENQGRFLSQFALVHRQCWQLARPYQFADIWITRSELSSDFLRHLETEVNSGKEPLIGSYIRSLTINVHEDFISIDFISGLPTSDRSSVEDWRYKWELFIDRIGIVVRTSLPNLRQVYWMNTGELNPKKQLLPAVLERATPLGRLETLYLEDFEFYFNNTDEVNSILHPFHSFCLRDLAFGFCRFPPFHISWGGATILIYESLLRRSAPTLESFVWNSSAPVAPITEDLQGMQLIFRNGFIPFERLNKFWASITDEIQVTVIESFLAAPLQSFAPSRQICSLMLANSLPEKYSLPHPRIDAVTGVENAIQYDKRVEYVDEVMQLGRRYGPQLDELFVYLRGFVDEDLDLFRTHFSSGSFSNLRSLCFSWTSDVDLGMLQAVGSNLLALEELSFGFQPEYDETAALAPHRPHFDHYVRDPPCHVDIIAAIQPLQNLERLSVFGDEYVADWAGNHWAWNRFFKDHVWFHQGRSFIQPERRGFPGEGQTWSEAERGHKRPGDEVEDWLTPWVTGTETLDDARHAVAELAAEYAEALPKLKEFMSGRVLVDITGR
ncbi:uncharacterized protein F5Z01DRAFT_687831 [Emericellopsis atlantica]|uniref:Uncharacterized protein n=1 Tax=Emericellopsis atlantica TaxID=2614577 RepID=A0A9P7ZLL6_9HYPO|nr:uncharacterized protein F5Z01DRAFT_687831 [Emericellopsis atlantica]KAG9254201.1 hypothetical protein F5Z01DRAFT_687831 [Emericellopsis atlantica]